MEDGGSGQEAMARESNKFDSNTQKSEAQQTQRNKDRSCTWAKGTTVSEQQGITEQIEVGMKMVSQMTSVAFELKILSSNGRAKRALRLACLDETYTRAGLCPEHPNPRIEPQTNISLPDPRSACHLTAHKPCPCTHQLQAPPTYYYCSKSHHHLPPQTLVEPVPAGTGDNHPPVPCAGSGPTWRQSIGSVSLASLSLVTPWVP
ncbi:hypothetical protein TIFTF001_053798 [Ficus carica]|uniref:Uncharacterized protein n=1 Tax=Ficus carica TaxID=3494 RepID=A0AA88EHC2_FICCA|nr:hypothetical protein TIFTF001_053795 [Ficus carica]GMN74121.1 hypothetical protein TIFTF001_053798 [Ficus carica]